MNRRAYIHSAALLLMSVFALGQLVMLLHFAVVKHEICGKHGLVSHLSKRRDSKGHSGNQGHPEASHCHVLAWVTSPKAEPLSTGPVLAEPPLRTTEHATIEEGSPHDQRELFELSPAHSPPF